MFYPGNYIRYGLPKIKSKDLGCDDRDSPIIFCVRSILGDIGVA